MRIAIDASRTTRPDRTGTETYALRLLQALLPIAGAHQLDLYFRDTPPPDLFPPLPQVQQHVIPFPRLWTHLRWAAETFRRGPDVIWTPAHSLPFFFRGRGVVTVHDLGYKHFPQAHPPREYRYLDWSTRHSARAAARIMADSAATRADLTAFYAIPPEKIGLVYAGVEDSLGPVTDPAQLAAVRARYGLPERYWLFLGTLQPRKNIARLVQAFEAWRQKSGDESAVLALGGKAGWLYDPAWLAPSRQVQLLGYVADSDRAALYSGALGFVFPSLYEGFGFPVLEAMRCACPVLCANTSSLPELAGEAAVLVDPLSVESIATGMDELLARRDELISRGRAQQARFTWARAAESALAILEDA